MWGATEALVEWGSPSEKQEEAAIKRRVKEHPLDLAVRLFGNHREPFP